MDRAILDTDVYSEILRAKNARIVEHAQAYRAEHGAYTLTAATVVELVKGLQQAGRLERLDELVLALAVEEILPIDREVAIVAGRIYGELDRTGQTIGRADPLIAGAAVHHNLVLVTGNTQHFERIQRLGFQLQLADWRT
jgi:tRNA(fMet)-specific endonuclease VapC